MTHCTCETCTLHRQAIAGVPAKPWDPSLEHRVGERVRFTSSLDLYPHALIEVGEVGTVTYLEEGDVGITLDLYHEGLAGEWKNEAMFYHEYREEGPDPVDYLEVIA